METTNIQIAGYGIIFGMKLAIALLSCVITLLVLVLMIQFFIFTFLGVTVPLMGLGA